MTRKTYTNLRFARTLLEWPRLTFRVEATADSIGVIGDSTYRPGPWWWLIVDLSNGWQTRRYQMWRQELEALLKALRQARSRFTESSSVGIPQTELSEVLWGEAPSLKVTLKLAPRGGYVRLRRLDAVVDIGPDQVGTVIETLESVPRIGAEMVDAIESRVYPLPQVHLDKRGVKVSNSRVVNGQKTYAIMDIESADIATVRGSILPWKRRDTTYVVQLSGYARSSYSTTSSVDILRTTDKAWALDVLAAIDKSLNQNQ